MDLKKLEKVHLRLLQVKIGISQIYKWLSSIVCIMFVGRIVFMNLADDLLAACTSILAYDSNGNLWHARNLDYGEFMGCVLCALR